MLRPLDLPMFSIPTICLILIADKPILVCQVGHWHQIKLREQCIVKLWFSILQACPKWQLLVSLSLLQKMLTLFDKLCQHLIAIGIGNGWNQTNL